MNIVLYHGRHVRFTKPDGGESAGQIVAMYPGVSNPQRVTVQTYDTETKYGVKASECRQAVQASIKFSGDARECVQDENGYWYHVLNLNWRVHQDNITIDNVTPISNDD